MKYITAIEAAKKWELSERSVRNYCAEGRVAGAILLGKTWMIPEDAAKPMRKGHRSHNVLSILNIQFFVFPHSISMTTETVI